MQMLGRQEASYSIFCYHVQSPHVDACRGPVIGCHASCQRQARRLTEDLPAQSAYMQMAAMAASGSS